MGKKRTCNTMILLAAFLLTGALVWRFSLLTVRAQGEAKSNFSVQAELVHTDQDVYGIRLTVENAGEDWSGTARLCVDERYYVPCAYDTELSLPQGTRKQFTVNVPVKSISRTNGTVTVTLWDEAGTVCARTEFPHFLTGQREYLSMGILSDADSDLTYLDMGGNQMYFYEDSYPIKLKELEQGSLTDELNTLTFLVIDRYHTDILTQEELEAIELWNNAGGILLIGTGAYAADTLKGFENGYLGITWQEDSADGGKAAAGQIGSALSQMTLTQLEPDGNVDSNYMRDDYETGGFYRSVGMGSVAVLPYSLVELGGQKGEISGMLPEDFAWTILIQAAGQASIRYSASSWSESSGWQICRLLSQICNDNSHFSFGILKVIVILYVIFVGPVLYLILGRLKRRELYWAAVPAAALLGIALVYWAGRGFEVKDTKIYSVTVQDLSGKEGSVSYLCGFDASRSEWSHRVAIPCDYAGPCGESDYHDGGEDEYQYHIRRDGAGFLLGMKPDSNFENGYFCAGSAAGQIQGELLWEDGPQRPGGMEGTVVNRTEWDLVNFAVIRDGEVMIYGALPAGESCVLADREPLYTRTSIDGDFEWYLYDLLWSYHFDEEKSEHDDLAALGIGVTELCPRANAEGSSYVIGLVKDWERVMDQDCSEISYGCLYSAQ